MSLKIRCRIAAVLIGMSVMSGVAAGQTVETPEKTEKIQSDTKKAAKGAPVHKLSLFSAVQNYQVDRRRAVRSLLITVSISSDDGLAYFCNNRPRLREAILRVLTRYYRVSRGGKDISEDEVSRRTRAIFAGYLEKDWLVKVDAQFMKNPNDAGAAVKKTHKICAEATS